MDARVLLELAGVFLGGALPWLEAIVVIPLGIAAGLHPVAAVVAGASGNLVTVAAAAFFGERVRHWWQRRHGQPPPSVADKPRSRRSRWLTRILARWGMPGLALLGPLGIGTQLAALIAVAVGHSARKSFAWIAGGTVLWCIAVAIMASLGLRIAGLGAG